MKGKLFIEDLTDIELEKLFLEKFLPRIRANKTRRNYPDNQFDLTIFNGKKPIAYRRIGNPQAYNPEQRVPNPEYYDALVFNDRHTVLLLENLSDGECSNINAYYFDGEKVLFTSQLFSGRAKV